jgi:hypothetical protein
LSEKGQFRHRVASFLRSPALLAGLLGAGALLRIWQYLGNAAFWLDELAVVRNVVDHPVSRLLTRPLDYRQVAPPGFLLIERGMAVLWGGGERSLRLFPLLSSLAALYLFWRFAERLLSGLALTFAVALFAFSPELIFYGADVKQYASDLAVALLLTLLVFGYRAGPPTWRRALLLGAAGAAAVWLSQPAVFMLAGLGGALLLLAAADRRASPGPAGPLAPTLTAVALWGLSSAASVLVASRAMDPAGRAFMQRFWQPAFLPPLVHLSQVAEWLANSLAAEFGREGLNYRATPLYVAAAALGFAVLWRRRRDAALLLAAPIAVTLAAAAARQYPFKGRLIAFLIPCFLIPVAAGVEQLYRAWPPRLRAAGLLCLALFAAFPIATFVGDLPVYRLEETPRMLAYVQARRQAGDAVYAYYGAEHALRFYGPRYGFDDDADYALGSCYFADPRAFLRELDRFRGQKRVWVLFVHALPRMPDRVAIIGYLDRIGARQGGVVFPATKQNADTTVYAYLYDLSDPRRLAAASAESYPLPPSGPPDPRVACQGAEAPSALAAISAASAAPEVAAEP